MGQCSFLTYRVGHSFQKSIATTFTENTPIAHVLQLTLCVPFSQNYKFKIPWRMRNILAGSYVRKASTFFAEFYLKIFLLSVPPHSIKSIYFPRFSRPPLGSSPCSACFLALPTLWARNGCVSTRGSNQRHHTAPHLKNIKKLIETGVFGFLYYICMRCIGNVFLDAE